MLTCECVLPKAFRDFLSSLELFHFSSSCIKFICLELYESFEFTKDQGCFSSGPSFCLFPQRSLLTFCIYYTLFLCLFFFFIYSVWIGTLSSTFGNFLSLLPYLHAFCSLREILQPFSYFKASISYKANVVTVHFNCYCVFGFFSIFPDLSLSFYLRSSPSPFHHPLSTYHPYFSCLNENIIYISI